MSCVEGKVKLPCQERVKGVEATRCAEREEPRYKLLVMEGAKVA